jgi:aldehyde:ferredoxin oxidoreductase
VLGSHGRVLRVDLGTGRADVEAVPELVYRQLIGGTGLAVYLLDRDCPAGADPLGPENPLVFAASPFVGTGITTASKLAVAARSPQTGLVGDSLSSSYLAGALKRTGVDALVLRGRADRPSVLVVDDGATRFLPADDLLGRGPAETATALRRRLGAAFRVAAIGVAGERGVRYAAIANDGRLAGRTGGGAVMGAKNLKAIAVRGTHPTRVADARGLAVAARALAERSLGPATAKYREVGTAANVAFFERLGILPTRNFGAGGFGGSEALAGETLLLEHGTDRHACASCTVGCEHRYRTTDGGALVETRLEYESLYALGPLCGVDDPNTVLRAAALCDRLGMDALSAGGTIAWAMECARRGVDLGVPDGEVPRFGDAARLLGTLEAIGQRRGLGDLLAEGSRRAAELVGQGSADWAMHVKGLELPGYDPRKLPTMALGLAVSARGACHNRSGAYQVDLSDRLTPDAADEARARAAAESEDQASVLDSLTVCKFLRHCFDDFYAEAGQLHELVTGHRTDLRAAGERITHLKKLFNERQGWSRADDTLPPALLGGDLSRERLDGLVGAYYRVRGWWADGSVPPGRVAEVGLGELPGPGG